jgi:SAM-dependent methyltransferase
VGGLGEAAARFEGEQPMKLYSELAPWFHLLTHPKDYVEEADFTTRLVDAITDGEARTLLELGSGGGNNASHLKRRFQCTLTDVSPQMLELSRSLNPECEHVEGDMRTLRLGRTFDAVFVHDAISYITTEDDLRATIQTAAAHVRPGGAVVLVPDETRESHRAGIEAGGHDGDDARSLRYLMWTHEPVGTTYEIDFALVLREPGQPTRVEHDHHVNGVFPEATWRLVIEEAVLELVDVSGIDDPNAGEHAVFVARRPA